MPANPQFEEGKCTFGEKERCISVISFLELLLLATATTRILLRQLLFFKQANIPLLIIKRRMHFLLLCEWSFVRILLSSNK